LTSASLGSCGIDHTPFWTSLARYMSVESAVQHGGGHHRVAEQFRPGRQVAVAGSGG
jgi:hypothetical protein